MFAFILNHQRSLVLLVYCCNRSLHSSEQTWMALYLNSYVMAMIYTSLPSLEGSTVQTTLAVCGSLVLSFGQMQYGLQPVCLKASVALSLCCCCAVIGLVSTISSNGVKHKKPRTRQQDTGNQAT